jgi:hypothetical protein
VNLRRWTRTNRWGLIALVPMLALAMAVPVNDFYTQRWKKQPHDQVAASAGGSVSYNHSTMTLVTLFRASGLQDFTGQPIAVPAGVAIWQAKLRFRSATPDAVGNCSMYLATADGSTYDANPNELNELGLSMEDLPYCLAATDEGGKALNDWTLTLYFLTPASAKPVGIQVNADRELPRYALIKPA